MRHNNKETAAVVVFSVLLGLFLFSGCLPETKPEPDLILLKGETAEILLDAGAPCPVDLAVPEGLKVTALELRPVVTLRKSFPLSSGPGEYLDALAPCETAPRGVWLDVTGVTPGRYVLGKYSVLVLSEALPARPTLPFYAEVSFASLSSAAGLADTSQTLAARAALVKESVAFIRGHLIEPIKQNLRTFPAIAPTADAPADHDSLVITGAIAPPMIIRDEGGALPSTAQLVAYEQAIQSGRWPKDSWAYVMDERQRDAGVQAELKRRSDIIRASAPSLQQWVTWEEVPAVRSLVDGFWPVLDWFKYPAPEHYQEYTKPYGLYTSNMAHLRPGVSSINSTPMSVIEAPPIHFQMFPVVVYALGGKRALYYSLTDRLRTAWEPGGQWWNEGNGDGTATYMVNGKLHASVRLKYWRYGQASVEYLRLLGEDGRAMVTSPFEWVRVDGPLRDLRVRLAKKLGAL